MYQTSRIMYRNSDYFSRDSMLLRMCTHSTSKLGRYLSLSLNVIGLELTTSIAEYLDHGFHHLAIPFSIRVWFFSRPDIVAMGIRHWIHVFGYRCDSDCVFHGRNVRSDGTTSKLRR
jgi:hypothetical protein